MSAFGKRGGAGGTPTGNRPAFGVARPMQGSGGPSPDEGGKQFPPLEAAPLPGAMAGAMAEPAMPDHSDAMARLNDRQSNEMEAAPKAEGFEASVHKIKEQVLPRLLERVDPEAAATLNKEELAEEFRPIIGEVLAELNEKHRGRVVTELLPELNYTRAETYHQHYFANHPEQGYCAFVVAPKVEKFVQTFAARVRPG